MTVDFQSVVSIRPQIVLSIAVLVLVLARPGPFEYRFAEYEYRFAEYEYRFAEYEYRFAEYEYRFAEYE